VFGWQDDELQKGMDARGCFGAKCQTMVNQNVDVAKKCSVSAKVKEDIEGCKSTFIPRHAIDIDHLLGLDVLPGTEGLDM
jgi:hypothetical protein